MSYPTTSRKGRSLPLAVIGSLAFLSGVARAGNVFLTGHDVLLHSGARGYSDTILEYLRNGEGTKATYDVLYVTSGGTAGGLAAVTAAGYNVTTISHAAYGANPAAALAGKDVFVLPWQPDGGVAGSAAVTSAASKAAIAAFFNAGGDIWADSSVGVAGFYDFLPPGATADGPAIGASNGFTPTVAGAAIGITSNMVNGDPTHNSFSSFAPAFTVFERFGSADTGAVISIGLRDGVISTGGITTGGAAAPDSGSTVLLLAMALPVLALLRRKVRS